MTAPTPYSADPVPVPLSIADRALAAEALAHLARALEREAEGCGDVDAASRQDRAARARALATRLVKP